MTPLLLPGLISVGALLAVLQLWRWRDQRAAAAAWAQLSTAAAASPDVFDPAEVAALPAPARRYFEFSIAPGTRLCTAVELVMAGELVLGSAAASRALPMRATQILTPPQGLVWRLQAGRGLMRLSGSDGIAGQRSWVRFWLLGLLPVVRAGGGPDHLRAAFGRVVAEAAIWVPAALLPRHGVRWEAVDANTARATVVHRGLTQTLDLRVDADGRPRWVRIARWTDANPQRVFRLQPFGGEVSEFRVFDGYTLPTRVEGGNFFGTPAYAPFYTVRVMHLRVLPAAADRTG